MKLIADNYKEGLSSCYFLDMRNSTFITRVISLDDDSKSEKASDRLKIHAEFMLKIHEELTNKLNRINSKEYYFDDTGDGHFCLLWTRTHAWDILDIACTIAQFLRGKLEAYNNGHLKAWSDLKGEKLNLSFGMGIHTGGSLVYQDENSLKKYSFGIVLNTASRLEGQTKNYKKISLIFTGNFKTYLELQQQLLENDKRSDKKMLDYIRPVSAFSMDIKDSKADGHLLYTILPDKMPHFVRDL